MRMQRAEAPKHRSTEAPSDGRIALTLARNGLDFNYNIHVPDAGLGLPDQRV